MKNFFNKGTSEKNDNNNKNLLKKRLSNML